MYKNSIKKLISPSKCSLHIFQISKVDVNNLVRYYAAPRKRFYNKTNILFNDGKFEVTLDQRKLKTPKGKLFYVTNEPLALAIAQEWNRQQTHIIPSTMHLTGLSNTVLDNPNRLKKEDFVHHIMKYLETDTILYNSSEDDDLYDLQLSEWKPVLNWFNNRFNVEVEPTRSISYPKIDPETKEIISKYLLSYNIWAVNGFVFTVEALKSVILALACAERHISVEKAAFLSRLEEEFQGKRWGRIEWAHELNQQDTQARVAAGILFIYFNSSSTFVKNKTQII